VYTVPNLLGLFLAACALSACTPKRLSADELTAYIEDPANEFHQTQQLGEIQVDLTYQPTDLLVVRDLHGEETGTSAARLESVRKKYNNSTYFLLSISKGRQEVLQPREDFSHYSQLLQTMAFRMGEYVRLITAQGDTLRPSNYYLDRTYAASSASQLLFAFPVTPTKGLCHFTVAEFGLGIGAITFPFDSQLTKSAPHLALH
jgi:hypothetical protein